MSLCVCNIYLRSERHANYLRCQNEERETEQSQSLDLGVLVCFYGNHHIDKTAEQNHNIPEEAVFSNEYNSKWQCCGRELELYAGFGRCGSGNGGA